MVLVPTGWSRFLHCEVVPQNGARGTTFSVQLRRWADETTTFHKIIYELAEVILEIGVMLSSVRQLVCSI